MEEVFLQYFVDLGSVGILGALCFYLVIHFNKAILKTNDVIEANTKAINQLAEATNKHSLQLERIEGFIKRVEDKIDRLKEDFIKRGT